MTRSFTATLSATLLLAMASAPALAADKEVRTTVVDYSDLNLGSKAGVDALRHRLILASRDVCGEAGGHEPSEVADTLACRNASLQDALRDLRQAVAQAESRHQFAVASTAGR